MARRRKGNVMRCHEIVRAAEAGQSFANIVAWFGILIQQCDTAEAEMKVPSVENPELTNVLPLKPGVGQNYSHICFAYYQEFLHCLNFDLPGPFTLNIFQILWSVFNCVIAKAVSPIGINYFSAHNHNHNRFKQIPVVSAYGIQDMEWKLVFDVDNELDKPMTCVLNWCK